MNVTLQDLKPEDIQPGSAVVEKHPHLFPKGEGTLKWQTRNKKRNGLAEAGAVLIINGREYINVPLYLRWLITKSA